MRARRVSVMLDSRRIDCAAGAVRAREDDARVDPGLGAAFSPVAGEARVSLPGGCAIGLRTRRPAREGARSDGRDDRPRAWLNINATGRLRGATIVFDIATVTEHRKPPDGGHARGRHDDARECRARAGDRRPRALPHRHGRAHCRRGERPHHGGGRRRASRRDACRHAGPDRDGDVPRCRGGPRAATSPCAARRPIRSRP